MKRTILLGCALALAACGGNNEESNGTKNNTTPNNVNTNNMTTPNNVMTNNMTTPNNVMTNNMTTPNNNTNNTNNTNANPYGLMGECGDLSYDQDGDGTVDATQLQELDAAGGENNTALVTDIGADGTTDWASRSTWNADGLELTRDEDNDGDGTYDRHIEWTYDAEGRLLSLILDEGDTMDAFTIVNTYDANGNQLTSTRDGSFDDMNNLTPADGTPDFTYVATFNGDNIETLNVDANGDGTMDMVITATFDANGNVTHVERDGLVDFETNAIIRAPDGTPDVIRDFTWDANDMIATLQQDGDVGDMLEQSDGTFDRFERNFVFDANDQLSSFEVDGRLTLNTETVGVPANGTFDLVTYEYDANGNATMISIDEGNTGTVDVVTNATWDADSQLLTRTNDGVINNNQEILSAADGTPDYTEVVTYEGVEMPLTQNIDVDGDGTDDMIVVWTWDANGNQTYFSRDGEVDIFELVSAADGTLDQEVTWTYDAMGRITSFNEMVDGAQGQIGTWEYMMCSDFL